MVKGPDFRLKRPRIRLGRFNAEKWKGSDLLETNHNNYDDRGIWAPTFGNIDHVNDFVLDKSFRTKPSTAKY